MSSKSIYLISPKNDFPSIYTLDALSTRGVRLQHVGDLALTTVASTVPDDFQVHLCDEVVSDIDFDASVDYVAITGKAGQIYRMIAIGEAFRRRGKVVIMGGPFASLNADFLKDFCDVLVVGELEGIAEELFADLRRSQWKDRYVGPTACLEETPLPRWDLYPNDWTVLASVQTSRGCPFACEFCDVIVYLGRKQRHKPVANVLRELELVYEHGHRNVFLADDNLTVYVRRAKELAGAVAEWNADRPDGMVRFSTQVSIEASRNDDLLSLWAQAGLMHTFIGIETPNTESLMETHKRQNLLSDLNSDVDKFLAHGIGVLAGMIVGFDSDGLDIFDRQYQFAMSTPIPIFALNALVAPPGTPLFERLTKEKRTKVDGGTGFMLGSTNFTLAQMSARELQIGFQWLANRLYEPAAFEYRLLRFIEEVQCPEEWGRRVAPRPLERYVDGEVLSGICHLGPREAELVAKVESRLRAKPQARWATMDWLRYYHQLRYAYAEGGLWDPQLAHVSDPFAHGLRTQG